MKNTSCPNKIACYDYNASNCDDCVIGKLIIRLKQKNARLQAKNATYAGRILEAMKILQNSDGFKAQTAIHTAISILCGDKDKNFKKRG